MGDLVLETYFAFSWGYQSPEGKGGEGGGHRGEGINILKAKATVNMLHSRALLSGFLLILAGCSSNKERAGLCLEWTV